MLKQFVQTHLNHRLHKGVLCYLSLGTFLAMLYAGTASYFETIGLILSNKTYLCVFVFPAFLMFFLYYDNDLSCNHFIVTRFTSRKKFLRFRWKSMILHTLVLFVELLLVITILNAILYSLHFRIELYELILPLKKISISNIVYALSRILKVVGGILFLQALLFILKSFTKMESISVILMIGIILFIYVQPTIVHLSFLSFLLPGTHIYQYCSDVSFSLWMVLDFLYFCVVGLLCYFIHFSILQRQSLLGEKI